MTLDKIALFVNAWLTQFVPDLIFSEALCRLRGIELGNLDKTADRYFCGE